jgi:antitoxin HicB
MMARDVSSETWPVRQGAAEEGGFIVNFPDLPTGWRQGENEDEALRQAEDLLEEIVLGAMAHKEDLPQPAAAAGRTLVRVQAPTAAKLEAYRGMGAAGLKKPQLADRRGWRPFQVTRLFDGRHGSRLDQIEGRTCCSGASAGDHQRRRGIGVSALTPSPA